jgi:hypothetical protein
VIATEGFLLCPYTLFTPAWLECILQDVSARTEAAEPKFVEQAGSCGRCRSELGQAGRLCEHCQLDELLVGEDPWEGGLGQSEWLSGQFL